MGATTQIKIAPASSPTGAHTTNCTNGCGVHEREAHQPCHAADNYPKRKVAENPDHKSAVVTGPCRPAK